MAFLKQEARVVEGFRIVELAQRELVTEEARRFGCSRTTVYELLARYQEGRLRALMNRPREPTTEKVVALVVELKTSAPPIAPPPRSSSCYRSAAALDSPARASGASSQLEVWRASWTPSSWCDWSDPNPTRPGRWTSRKMSGFPSARRICCVQWTIPVAFAWARSRSGTRRSQRCWRHWRRF